VHREQLLRERPSRALPIATLRLAVAQPLTLPEDIAGNVERHAAAVREADARLVVFPECSLTGYELEAEALDPADPRLRTLIDACRDTDSVAFAGGIVVAAGGSHARSIGTLAINGSGATVVYRKMHLGGQEPEHLVAGGAPAVIDLDGWRLGLAICRDTGIPSHAAATAALGIDAYVAGVLEDVADQAEPETRARRVAVDHGVWVAIASFAGSAGGDYDDAGGGSGIWRPDGSAAARAGRSTGTVVAATLSS
jgi:predicted amidohydrolase